MLKLMIYQKQKKKKEPAEESTKEEEEPVQSAASWEEPDQKRVNPIWQFFTLFFGFCFLSLFSFL